MGLPTLLWLICLVLAQSALTMAFYLLQMKAAPDQLTAILSHNGARSIRENAPDNRQRRSVLDAFQSYDSWFTWDDPQVVHHGQHQKSASGFPEFKSFSFPSHDDVFTFDDGHKECCQGRASTGVGPKFITNVKGVPEETKNQFYKPETETTSGRRSKYGLDKQLRTPSHAYRIAEKVPFFDTFDHKAAVLTLVHFRSENKIPVLKLMSIRPHFPFYISV